MSNDTSNDTSLAVPAPSRRALALVEMTETVQELIDTHGVELDIPVEQVASMAVERKLSVEEVDALLLARQDYAARFPVMDLLLRSGFTTDQIHAAYAFVDQHDLEQDRKIEAAPISGVVEEPESLADLVRRSTTEPARAREHEGATEMDVNRRHKYVAMIATWFATFDVFDDLAEDLDGAISLLTDLAAKAREARFVKAEMNDLDVLTRLLVRVQGQGIETYDGVLRLFAERS